MPVFMHGIAAADKSEHVRKGADNCARTEKENKLWFKENRIYIIVKTEEKEK